MSILQGYRHISDEYVFTITMIMIEFTHVMVKLCVMLVAELPGKPTDLVRQLQ